MTFSDPELGDCQVFRAGVSQILGFVAAALFPVAFVAVVLVGTSQHSQSTLQSYVSPTPDYTGFLVLGVALWVGACFVGALWEARLELVVGERGVRYWRPSGPVQVAWSQVSDVQIQVRRGRAPRPFLVISLKTPVGGSSQIKMGPTFTFNARWLTILSVIQARFQAAGGGPARELGVAAQAIEPAIQGAEGTIRPSQHALAMAREAVKEESFVYGEGLAIAAATKSMSATGSGGLAKVLRTSRFFTWGPLILGIVPLAVVLAPFIGHLTGPSHASLDYYTWRDPMQSVTVPYVVGWTLLGILCWAYSWWNLKLKLTIDERGFSIEKAWQPRLEVVWTSVTSVGWQNPSLTRGGGAAIEYRGVAGQPKRLVIGGLRCAVATLPALMAIETAWERSRGAQASPG